MIKSLLLALAFVSLLAFPAEARKPKMVHVVTGIEWLQLSAHQRQDEIVKALGILMKSGVQPVRLPHEYYSEVYSKLRQDQTLYPLPVTSILANYVWESEPESRPAIDALRIK